MKSSSSSPARRMEPVWFSRREREVLSLLCRGWSNKQIAARIEISVGGVRFHLTTLLRKLRLQDRTEMILWCLQHPEDVSRGRTEDPRLHPVGCACGGACCSAMQLIGKAA
jgi:DNA-binding CsgD family transcriptional regulator